MNNIKRNIINIFGVFLLTFLTHFIYDLFPSYITSILFPINESLFEHMKLISTTYIIWSIIEHLIFKDNFNKSNLILSIIINIIIFLIIYYPIYLNFEHNLIVTLLIYLLSIILTNILINKISNFNFKFIDKYFYIIMFIIIFIFAYFTYFPLKNDFFIDKMNKKIGFSNYY